MTLTRRKVFDIHRLRDMGLGKEAIGRQLGISVPTVTKYMENPEGTPGQGTRKRPSILDPFQERIERMLEECPEASAVVIRQRLAQEGYAGGLTVLRDYLRKKRPKKTRTYWHFESLPGACFQVDWGSFGTMAYGQHRRPLFCFAMIECFSRMLFFCFTHSEKLEVFIDCHVQAFRFYGGCCREIVVDNTKTAVIERDGKLVRFNDTYLDFLRRVHAVPYACTPRAAWEKGKIESSIGFIRNNFFPLRRFKDLFDLNEQAARWRDEVANTRVHQTTGEKPVERFKHVSLQPLSGLEGYDSRETLLTTGPQDLRIKLDANRYSIPFWVAEKPLVVKASSRAVTIYCGKDIVARHERCWGKYQSVINPLHREGMTSEAHKAHASRMQEILLGLGPGAMEYLKALQHASLPMKRTLQHLVELKDRFGHEALLRAMQLSLERKVLGADYVEQILLQLSHPSTDIPRLELRGRPELSHLSLSDVDLAAYDNALIRKGRGHEER